MSKVFFLHANDNQTKIQLICQCIHEAVIKEKKILIVVSNNEAALYIDALLWRVPEESFLPHRISSSPNQEWVVITTNATLNLNQADCLFNLDSAISPIYKQFCEIYELYDKTHPQKAQLAQKKLEEYQALGLNIIERKTK
jgi:DNA polymerase-3 subunit chi